MDCIENYGIITVKSRSRSPDCDWGGVWDCEDCWRSEIIEAKVGDKVYRKNGEGYPDPTAADAIREADRPPEQLTWFIRTVRELAKVFDYDIVGRIVVRDNRTGKIYK